MGRAHGDREKPSNGPEAVAQRRRVGQKKEESTRRNTPDNKEMIAQKRGKESMKGNQWFPIMKLLKLSAKGYKRSTMNRKSAIEELQRVKVFQIRRQKRPIREMNR
jgi:hypothetical protein